jgi:hypothetical protein
MKHELGQLAEQGSPGLLDGGDCRSTGSAGIGSQFLIRLLLFKQMFALSEANTSARTVDRCCRTGFACVCVCQRSPAGGGALRPTPSNPTAEPAARSVSLSASSGDAPLSRRDRSVKDEGHTRRCCLKVSEDDAVNVVLSASGYTFRVILASLRTFLRPILHALIRSLVNTKTPVRGTAFASVGNK